MGRPPKTHGQPAVKHPALVNLGLLGPLPPKGSERSKKSNNVNYVARRPRETLSQTWSNLVKPGPQDPRPPNLDPKVPTGSTQPRQRVLKVWSRSDCRIAHDRTIGQLQFKPNLGLAFSEYPELRFTICQFLYDPRNTRNHIREIGFDPTARTHRTHTMHNRHSMVRGSNDV